MIKDSISSIVGITSIAMLALAFIWVEHLHWHLSNTTIKQVVDNFNSTIQDNFDTALVTESEVLSILRHHQNAVDVDANTLKLLEIAIQTHRLPADTWIGSDLMAAADDRTQLERSQQINLHIVGNQYEHGLFQSQTNTPALIPIRTANKER